MIARSSKICLNRGPPAAYGHNISAVDSSQSMPLALISSISSNPSYR
jgi:hypothetical protein